MVGNGVALRLPLLGHNIAHVHLQCVGGLDGLHDATHQKVWDDAGVEAPGTQDDHVRVPDGGHRRRQSLGVLRDQPYLADAAVLPLLAVEDLGLPHHAGAVFKLRLQLYVRRGHRQHPAGDSQNLAHAAHRHIKGGRNAVKGRQEQIAEALSRQRPLCEAVMQQLPHHRLRIGQCLHTVPNVTGGRHPQVLPQHSGAAAVVRHGDHGREVFRILLEPPQHVGKAVSAADDGDPGPMSPGHPVGRPLLLHGRHLKHPGPGPGGSPSPDSPADG